MYTRGFIDLALFASPLILTLAGIGLKALYVDEQPKEQESEAVKCTRRRYWCVNTGTGASTSASRRGKRR